MATPLISPLRIQGGTFYSFTSAVKDIQKTFTDDDARFVFSKFVLIDIPNVQTPTANNENYVVWEAIGSSAAGGTSSIDGLSGNQNINLAQSFQNYALNFEAEILEGSNDLGQSYDNSTLRTTSERIFWKWLTQINAIRFRSSTVAETSISGRYTEADPTQYYNRVVKYIGDIDAINNVSRGGHSYSEIYINTPTQHGSTPLIMWKTVEDTNYSPGRSWTNGNEYIQGRDSSSTHPSGLSVFAYYDNDSANSYNTGATFGLVTNVSGTANAPSGSGKSVLLSSMDGAVLDFDPVNYTPIVTNPTISSFTEFNATDAASDFTFNAALIYYDSYSASDSANSVTNLYGILILDDFETSADVAQLKRFDKFKPNKVTKLNGNGYSLKLNVKFDSTVDNAGVEVLINDYNTFSMDLFIDASTRLQESAEMFLNTENDIINMKTDIDQLKSFLFSQDQLDILAQRVSALETSLNNAKLAFSSSTTLLDLINQNADNVNKILSGNLSLNLTYNTEVLNQGDGIFLDRSVPNQLTVANNTQSYNEFSYCGNAITVANPIGSLVTVQSNGVNTSDANLNNRLFLGKFSNYFKRNAEGLSTIDPITGADTFLDNLNINIDDTQNFWKKGQTFRIVFDTPINLNGFSIYIKTDSTNRFGQGNYGVISGIISGPDIITAKPIIDIICTDENLYEFSIDIIR